MSKKIKTAMYIIGVGLALFGTYLIWEMMANSAIHTSNTGSLSGWMDPRLAQVLIYALATIVALATIWMLQKIKILTPVLWIAGIGLIWFWVSNWKSSSTGQKYRGKTLELVPGKFTLVNYGEFGVTVKCDQPENDSVHYYVVANGPLTGTLDRPYTAEEIVAAGIKLYPRRESIKGSGEVKPDDSVFYTPADGRRGVLVIRPL